MGKPLLVELDPRQLAARREWLELSRRQIAEYAGIPLCAVDLLESGKEVKIEVANAYERSLDKLEFKKMMTNLP
jgi:predicted transcriptional regulator